MNCFKCATPLPDNARFCSICGTDVSGEHGHEKTLVVDHGGDAELMAKLQAELGTEYLIERELGRGGMAIVYLGHDAQLGRKVAVKVLPPELTFGSGGQVIERFRREARTSATLDHPNIIPVYRVSQGGKLFWYVMKYLDGEPLDRILERDGQLAVDRCVDIVRQTAEALDFAHHGQVIHRDIKPANIIVDGKGRVTVTDFGIAKALDASNLTATGGMVGTPYFMSPEQCSGKRVGPASDQYSLAVMTYLMLGGQLPFTGESVVDIVHQHVMDPVPPLAKLRPKLGKAIVTVVERALAKQPEQRFASCADFAMALEAASRGLSLAAVQPAKRGPSGVRMSKTALVSPVPGAIRTAKGSATDRRTLIVGAGALIGTGILVTALVLTRPGPAPAGGEDSPIAPIGTELAQGQPVAPPAASAPPTAAPVDSPPAAIEAPPVVRTATPTRRNQPSTANRQLAQPTSPTTVPPAATPLVNQTAPPQPAAETQTNPTVAPAAAGLARITVGSRPPSAMTINGRAVPSNPVSNYEVPAGNVTIVFTVTDTSGVWTVTRQLQVGAGESKNLGRIALVRP